MNRNLDGVYFRINREGKWENVCFSDLTKIEREQVLKDKDKKWLRSLCETLADTIKNIGEQLDLVCEND